MENLKKVELDKARNFTKKMTYFLQNPDITQAQLQEANKLLEAAAKLLVPTVETKEAHSEEN